jgi:hypothetical protein
VEHVAATAKCECSYDAKNIESERPGDILIEFLRGANVVTTDVFTSFRPRMYAGDFRLRTLIELLHGPDLYGAAR